MHSINKLISDGYNLGNNLRAISRQITFFKQIVLHTLHHYYGGVGFLAGENGLLLR